MSYTYPDDLFPFPLWIIPVFILLIYTIIMNGVSPDTIFTVIITVEFMVIIALWGGFYKIFLKRKLDEWQILKEKHKTSLYEGLLKKIHSNQQLSYFNYSVQFKSPTQLYIQSEKQYNLAHQHLRKKHNNITNNWDNTQIKASEINTQLNEIKEYISNKVESDIGKQYVERFTKDVWIMIQYHVFMGTNSLNILKVTKPKKGIVEIEYLPGRHFGRGCSGDEPKVIKFFTNLKNDKHFLSRISKVNSTYNELKSYFDKFKDKLENLIHRIENNGISELKGSCNECSFWKNC